MPEKLFVTVTQTSRTSAERFYDAWLDPIKARAWQQASLQAMGLEGDVRTVEIDPTVGGAFLFTDMRDGQKATHAGTYLELERPHRITFTFITDESEKAEPPKVTLALKPDDEGDGCLVTLTHELDLQWEDYVQQTERGWLAMIQACSSHA